MRKYFLAMILMGSCLLSQTMDLSTGIGVTGGMISGTGFSCRHMGEKSGFQISFGIMKFGEDEDIDNLYFSNGYTSGYSPEYWVPDTSHTYHEYDYGYGLTWGNIGLTYYKPLHKGKRSLFYAMGGVSTYYSSGSDYVREYKYTLLSDSTYAYNPISALKKITETDITYLIGAGIGLEFNLTNNIRISAELPLVFTNRGTITMFIPQIGLHYYYK